MKYLTRRQKSDDNVIFDSESNYINGKSLTKERIESLDLIFEPIIKKELKKIKNGTSILIKSK